MRTSLASLTLGLMLVWSGVVPVAMAAQKNQTATNAELAVYAAQFSECDVQETFGGVPADKLSLCGKDPNRLQVLERLQNGAIRYISKLSLDLDGGWKACNEPGETDLCPTTFVYEGWRQQSAAEQKNQWQAAFVSSDTVPYIVIPYVEYAGDQLIESTQFRDMTGIAIGDVGVVIQNDVVIPVLVADGGPHTKIGEGSLALFEKLGQSRCLEWIGDGSDFCRSVLNISLEGSVETYIFPNSVIDGLTPENTNQLVAEKAMNLYHRMLFDAKPSPQEIQHYPEY